MPRKVEWLSTAEAAKVIGVAQRTVRQAITEGRLAAEPSERDGYRIRRSDAEAYREARTPTPEQQSLMERRLIAEVTILEKRALKEAVLVRQAEDEAAILALRRGVAEGQLVERAEFHDYVNNLCVSIRTKLLAIPASLALDLSGKSNPKDCERVLRHAIENALTELDAALNDDAA
jgi:excisionase family DNA binding protein